MAEEWRELEWGPCLVSNRGRIAGIRKPWVDPKTGYAYCQTNTHEGKRLNEYAHQLVAEAFLGPRPPGCDVHHKNNDRGDNRPENLEYITRKDHVLITMDGFRRGEAHGGSKLTEDNVREIRCRYKAGGLTWPMLAKEYGVSRGAIQGILERRTWRHIE